MTKDTQQEHKHKMRRHPKWSFVSLMVLCILLPDKAVAFQPSHNNGRHSYYQSKIACPTTRLLSSGQFQLQPQQPRVATMLVKRDDDSNPPPASEPHMNTNRRRQGLQTAMLAALSAVFVAPPPQPSNAFGLFSEAPRRQLELCIVSLLRLAYWAEATAEALQSEDSNVRKSRYLESRLASKALVTGKIGGGASLNVYNLNALQLKGCLTDLVGYAGDNNAKSDRRKAQDLQTELLESLASVVEFDGLETTIDPSPRSSLTMSMYTEEKAVFVRRTLAERVVPTTNALIRLFPEATSACQSYVLTTYVDELPPRLKQQSQPVENGVGGAKAN